MTASIDHVDIVIYHDRCPDGKAGAWAFWRTKKPIRFYGCLHGQPPPNGIENQNVVIVDFCFPRGIIEEMAAKAKSITILDHHESAQDDLEGELPKNVKVIFDMNRSGAQIAWDYLYSWPRPWFIDVIADRDLWAWKIPQSKELGKGLSVKGYYTWEKMDEMYGMDVAFCNAEKVALFKQKMIEIGAPLVEQEEREISSYCSKSILASFTVPDGKKYTVRLASCPDHLRSEVGNRLCETNPDSYVRIDFAVLWRYDFLLDEWWISCRSISKENSVNLAKLTKQFYRGGGHRSSAGFTIFGSDRVIPRKELDSSVKSEEAVFVKGEKLQTYFKVLEVPKNRSRDAGLV